MAKPAITFRSTKGSPLTYTELDTNFDNLQDATIGFTVGGTNADIDLNSRLTVAAGDNVTLTLVGSTLTIAASGGATGNFVTTDTTQTITADKTFTGAVTTNDIQVNNEIFGPDFVSGTSTLNELTLYADDNGSSGEVSIRIANEYTTSSPFHDKGVIEFTVYGKDSGGGVLSRQFAMRAGTTGIGLLTVPGRIEFGGASGITDYEINGPNLIDTRKLYIKGTNSADDIEITNNPGGTPSNTTTPVGWLAVTISGTVRYIPYYS